MKLNVLLHLFVVLGISTIANAQNCPTTADETKSFILNNRLADSMDLEKIESIDTSTANFYEEDLKYLCHLKNLKNLYAFSDNKPTEYKIHGPGLVYLKYLQNLDYLDLDGNWITSENLKYLDGVNSVKGLKLYNNPLTKENDFSGIKYLMGMPELEKLMLQGHSEFYLTDADLIYLKALKDHPKLKYISFIGNQIKGTSDAFKSLASIRSLQELDLSGNLIDSDTDFTSLAGSNIHSINLSNTPNSKNKNIITANHLAQLSSLPNLSELNLQGLKFTPEDFKAFQSSNIKTLLLTHLYLKNEDEFINILKSIPTNCIVASVPFPKIKGFMTRLESEGLTNKVTFLSFDGSYECPVDNP